MAKLLWRLQLGSKLVNIAYFWTAHSHSYHVTLTNLEYNI